MHVAVFGATGIVGKSVVVKLIEQGHTVTVFEEGLNPFTNHPNIRIVQGDSRDASDIVRALEGTDMVISAAGGLRMNTETNLALTMRTILAEMEQRGIWRIVVLGDVVAHIEGDQLSRLSQWVYRFYKWVIPKILRDREDQIRFLQSSKADWTVVRAPGLRKRGGKGNWKLSLDPPYPWQHVLVDDVAEALIGQISDDRYLNQAPFVRSGK